MFKTFLLVNPCATGEPYRSQMGVLYCSAMSVCPNDYYCHIGGDTRTSVCCPTLSVVFKNFIKKTNSF